MQVDAATAVIVGIVTDEWSDTPVAMPNVDFTPPDAPWARLTVRWGDGFMRTFDGLNTIAGVVFFDIFTKPGRGEGPGLRLATQARTLFNNRDVGGVLFEAASGPQTPGVRDGWMQHQIAVPFSIDERV